MKAGIGARRTRLFPNRPAAVSNIKDNAATALSQSSAGSGPFLEATLDGLDERPPGHALLCISQRRRVSVCSLPALASARSCLAQSFVDGIATGRFDAKTRSKWKAGYIAVTT